MTAIAGILTLNDGPSARMEGKVASMLAAMPHRFDATPRTESSPPVCLGHGSRRVTARCQTASAVLRSRAGEWSIVLDGRIDNRDELRMQIEPWMRPGAGVSDAELLAALLESHGIAVVESLVGDFVFAAWHPRSGRLWLARDAVGARVVHWRRSDDAFCFASEEHALLAGEPRPAEPNMARVASLLIPGFEDFDPEETWLAGTMTLLPGHLLEIDRSGDMRIRCYWQPRVQPELRLRDDREYEEAFREHFLAAVRCRAQTLEPSALMLSGGLDSLAVWAAAGELAGRGEVPPMRAMSIVSDDPTCSESRHIREVTRDALLEPVFVNADEPVPDALRQEVCEVVWQESHPVDNAVPAVKLLAKRAVGLGHRALFSGASGDLTLYTSTLYLAEHLRSLRLKTFLKELQASRKNNTYLRGMSVSRLVGLTLRQALIRRWMSRLRSRLSAPRPVESRFLQCFAKATIDQLLAAREHAREAAWAARDAGEAAMHVKALARASLRCGLEGYGRVAARAGAVHLDPWSDQRLVAFCLSLPLDQKAGHGWTKYLARRVVGSWLGGQAAWNSDKYHLGWNLKRIALSDANRLAPPVPSAPVPSDCSLLHALCAAQSNAWPVQEAEVDEQFGRRSMLLWLGRI